MRSLFLAALYTVNHERCKSSGACGVIKRDSRKHYVMKGKRGRDNSKLEPRTALDPFDDMVDVKNEITSTVACFNNSEGMNVIVVPRHFLELGICPNLRRHFFVLPNDLVERPATIPLGTLSDPTAVG